MSFSKRDYFIQHEFNKYRQNILQLCDFLKKNSKTNLFMNHVLQKKTFIQFYIHKKMILYPQIYITRKFNSFIHFRIFHYL